MSYVCTIKRMLHQEMSCIWMRNRVMGSELLYRRTPKLGDGKGRPMILIELCSLWPLMSLFKGLLTVIPGGKETQKPWWMAWKSISKFKKKGFDAAAIASRVWLIKPWFLACTSVCWVQSRIKVLYCTWSVIQLLYYLTFYHQLFLCGMPTQCWSLQTQCI